jgi:hypothetical protein
MGYISRNEIIDAIEEYREADKEYFIVGEELNRGLLPSDIIKVCRRLLKAADRLDWIIKTQRGPASKEKIGP